MTRSSFIAYSATLAFLFLIPFFSIPFASFGIDSSKGMLAVLWGAIVLVAGVVGILAGRAWNKPTSITPLGLSAIALFLVMIASASVSPVARLSFFGDGFMAVTPLLLALLVGLGYTVSRFSDNAERSSKIFITLFWGLLIPVTAAALVLVTRGIFGLPDAFSSFVLGLAGKWNDLGLFALILLVISVSATQRFVLEGLGKWIGYGAVILSTVVLLIVNLRLTWYAILILSIGGLVALLRKTDSVTRSRTLHIAIYGIGALLSLVYIADNNFALFNGAVSNTPARLVTISAVEVYPSSASTLEVAKGVIAEDPLFGTGPARFNEGWKMYRPQNINLSEFWNNNFSYGVGLWPTFLVTTGILGMLAVIAFVLTLLFICIKVFRATAEESVLASYIFKITSIIVATMTLGFIIYAPGFAGYLVYAAFIGILAGCFTQTSSYKQMSVAFLSRSVWTKIVIMIICIAIAAGSVWVYAQKSVAAYHYSTASMLSSGSNIDLALVASHLEQAIIRDPQDIYVRTLASVMYGQFTSLLAATSTAYTSEQYQQMLNAVVSTADGSIAVNPYNAENYLFSAELFRAFTTLGIEGAEEQAMQRYELALQRDPHNPSISLLRARLALQSNDNDEAKVHLNEAIKQKPNYTEAVFLLSQLLVEDDEADEAIKSLESRALVAPAEPIVFFQLGFMKYSTKDYKGAVEALEPAVILVPEYSNALYFLGLSYYQLDRVNDAVLVFERISYLNPENTEVTSILNNLKQGRAPFGSQAVTPPEDREELPVDEDDEAVEE